MSNAVLRQGLSAACARLAEEPSLAPPRARHYGRLVRVTGLTLEVVGCRLVMGQKRRDVGKLLQGGANIAGEIRVVTIHNDSDIRHRR